MITGVHLNEKDHNTGRGTLHIDIDHAALHAGFGHNGVYLSGDVIEAVVGWCGYVDGFFTSVRN